MGKKKNYFQCDVNTVNHHVVILLENIWCQYYFQYINYSQNESILILWKWIKMYEKKEAHSLSYAQQFKSTIIRLLYYTHEPLETDGHLLTCYLLTGIFANIMKCNVVNSLFFNIWIKNILMNAYSKYYKKMVTNFLDRFINIFYNVLFFYELLGFQS